MFSRLWNRVLDRTVLFSFDRSGYRRHARDFVAADREVDLRGAVCVVTGANSGIGRAAAHALAARGAEVRLACRDRGRGEEAVEAIARETGNPRVHLDVLDVSSLADVRAFAARGPRRVDVLVHNAGVLPAERRETAEGLELTLATHVVGPVLLTRLWRERLGRVVLVSSGGMYGTRLSLADLDWRARAYDGVAAYAQTKRMQVVLAGLIPEKLGVEAHAMHPGWVDTPALRASLPGFFRVMRDRLRTPEEGADTVVWLAMKRGLPAGRFWLDRAEQPRYLLPFTRESAEERERLWERCGELSERERPARP